MVEKEKVGWRAGAMYGSELMWLKRQIEISGVDVLIECGRQDGISSRWYSENLSEDVDIFSIDLDDRPDVLARCKQNLIGTRVQAITGNVFEMVPELIAMNRGKKIAVVEDAVKGWPGLAILLASSMFDEVVLIAQHNLHKGHNSREFFEIISSANVFPEYSDSKSVQELHSEFRKNNYEVELETDRPIDHTSLGIISFVVVPKKEVLQRVNKYKNKMGIWAPGRLYQAWQEDVGRYLRRQRMLSLYTLARLHSR